MKLKIAQIQMSVTTEREDNVTRACGQIREAARQGAQIAVLPEMFCCPYENSAFRPYGEPLGGPVQQALAQVAREEKIYVVGGSLPELEGDQVYNTCFVYDPEGKCIARHRKMHLFDINVAGGQRFMESDTFSPGCDVTTFDTPWGTMGLCICFDFRFEELSRLMTLRGARVIFVPAAFNMTTGPAHWELLFRQRAVDNQLFTVGTSPARDVNASYVAWGHSIVCDPWGTVVTHCDETEQTVMTELDLDRVDSIRAQLPILSARREDVYSMIEK
ncbi:MAG: carbon-nitrogen hydrolase family protein [Ruminococcaceae bacterium]|nr:carbon-nitrogen hydrolase family protein [Oscillospiraceae bacterium]